MKRSCGVSIRPSDDAQTPPQCMKRAANQVGRGLKHFRARVVGLRSVLFGLSTSQAPSLGPQTWIIPFSLKDIPSAQGLWVCFFFFSSQLKNQIMNSPIQQEPISTECTFKVKLMTNNLPPRSREL